MIPAEAVEALAAVLAQEALVSADMDGHGWDAENDDPAPFMPRARERANAYLQAAAPYMMAKAKAEALIEAAEVAERGEGGGHDSGECDDWGAWLRARAANVRAVT